MVLSIGTWNSNFYLMPIFFHATPQSGVFNQEESRHIAKVLRHRPGDALTITNGHGESFEVVLISTSYQEVRFEITKSHIEPISANQLHIIIGVLKSDERMEWMLEKLTEIGCDEISLCVMDRTEGKPPKRERVDRIMISALKQSGRCRLPSVNYFASLASALQSVQPSENKAVAHLSKAHPQKKFSSWVANHRTNVRSSIIIGPEGDLSSNEIDLCLSQNFEPITLGNHVLRTETAALWVAAGYRAWGL